METATLNRNKVINGSLVTLETHEKERLKVGPDDWIFPAARDIVRGENVLLYGTTGSGKSLRSQGLTIGDNYPRLLAGTRQEEIEVEIEEMPVDLTPVMANVELYAEKEIVDGTSRTSPVMIARFILKHGFHTRSERDEEIEREREVLEKGKGRLKRFVMLVDDFDRTQHISITNSFMKEIEQTRHYLSHFDAVRYMNLQCVASSNRACGHSSGLYRASQGIDLAIYNRFQVYAVMDSEWELILKEEFPEQEGFVDKLATMATEVKREMAEGAFEALGEINLRNLRPVVEEYMLSGLPEIEAARKLFYPIPRDDEQRPKAEHLLNKYFGPGFKRDAFQF